MSVKETLQTKIENQLQEWETDLENFRGKLDDLRARTEELPEEAKQKYVEHIRILEERIHATQVKMDLGRKQIEQMKETAGDAWQEMKEGSQGAWEDLKTGIGNAWEELRGSMDVAYKKFRDVPKK